MSAPTIYKSCPQGKISWLTLVQNWWASNTWHDSNSWPIWMQTDVSGTYFSILSTWNRSARPPLSGCFPAANQRLSIRRAALGLPLSSDAARPLSLPLVSPPFQAWPWSLVFGLDIIKECDITVWWHQGKGQHFHFSIGITHTCSCAHTQRVSVREGGRGREGTVGWWLFC